MVWETRTTGATTNGGGFDPVSGTPGTDYSQQNAAQITYTDMVIGVGTSTFTSVLNPCTADIVGNVINVTSGTGFTVQRVQVLSVAAGVATVDKSMGTTGSTGGNGKLGGALSTLAAIAVIAPGNKVWVKASATYSITAAQAVFTTNGSSLLWITYEGYTTTRGDGGQVTVQRSSGSTISLLSGSGSFHSLINFIADGASGTAITGINPTGGTSVYLQNCKALNCTTAGFTITTARAQMINCLATGCSGTASFNITALAPYVLGCRATGGTCPGFIFNMNNTNGGFCSRCISDNNTGGSSQGFKVNNGMTMQFTQCAAYANGSDGILFDTTTASTCVDGGSIIGCILVGNTGFGINANAANVPFLAADYNFFYNNTGGARNNLPAGTHDVTGSGDPFANGASNDFTLNNTTGAGAACRAASWPGALQSGGQGYLDMGALQHQDSGGGSTTYIFPVFD